MLKQRVLVVVVLLPIGIAAIVYGGWAFALVVGLILGIAAWEYTALFQAGGWQPAGFLVVGGALAFVVARMLGGFSYDALLTPVLVLAAMGYHVYRYERGRDQAGLDFAITLSGIFYIGLLGSYFLALRALPHGQWWLLLVLPAIWLADSGAYFIGSKFGKNKMAPRLSPKKSWQGYFGGILVSVIGTPLFMLWYRQIGMPAEIGISLGQAAVLGLLLSVFPTIGDLGESMIKRMVGVKDSGTILPGHGGMFDRIDSWLWGIVIGYYWIVFFT